MGWGKTALHIASEYGHFHTVEMLLYLNANVNAQAEYQRTPLILAAQNNHIEVVKLLLSYYADVKVHDSLGRSAIDVVEDSETARDIMTYAKNEQSVDRFLDSKLKN